MAKKGKKYKKVAEKKDNKTYTIAEGIEKVKKSSYSKFVGTIELHVALKPIKDKEPKSIKGSISLPHSSEEKKVKIAVFTTPEDEKKAKEAGADLVGTEKLMKDVKDGKIDFDVAIATPSVMPQIAQIGKELGPKGLMPNPKTGTVTDDIAKAVEEYKKGKINFSADTGGVIHIGVGKIDLESDKIQENIYAVLKAIEEAIGKKEITQLVKSLYICPTMGTSVKFTN